MFQIVLAEQLYSPVISLWKGLSCSPSQSQLTEKHFLHLEKHHLIQDVSTWWSSTYFMFERLQEQCWGIYAILHEEKASEAKYRCLNPTEEQWTLLGDMTKVLKPLQVATTTLCEAEVVSISFVYPIINSLLTKYLLQSEEDSAVVRQLKKTVREDLQHRFTPDDIGIADKLPFSYCFRSKVSSPLFPNSQTMFNCHSRSKREMQRNFPEESRHSHRRKEQLS